MSFTINDLVEDIKRETEYPELSNDVILSGSRFVINYIKRYNKWNFLKTINESLNTTAGVNYTEIFTVDDNGEPLTGLTDIESINYVFLDSSKYRVEFSSDSTFLLESELFANDNQSVNTNVSSTVPRYYSDKIVSGRLYWNVAPKTSQKIILNYNKIIPKYEDITDNVPFPDVFEEVFKQSLIEYCLPLSSASNRAITIYTNRKIMMLDSLVLEEKGETDFYPGYGANDTIINFRNLGLYYER